MSMAFPARDAGGCRGVLGVLARAARAGCRRAGRARDVRVRPYGYDRTVVEFHAPEGVAVVHVLTAELRHFLRRSQHLVPTGREHQYLDWDEDLAHLLDG